MYMLGYIVYVLYRTMCVLFCLLLLQVMFNVTNSVITMNGLNNDDYLATLSPLSLSDVFMWLTSPQDEERWRMYGPSVP